MLQRLLIGSFVLPTILDRLNISNSKFKNMDPAQKLVLFNAFVGWDLPLWSLVKIIDVLEKIYTKGGDIMDLLKSDGDTSGNTANINVFTEFDNKALLNFITSFFYVLIPWKYYNTTCKFGNFGLFLFIIIGLIGSVFLSTWITNVMENKNTFDLPYKNNGSKWVSSIYIFIYFIILVILIANKIFGFNLNLLKNIPFLKDIQFINKECN